MSRDRLILFLLFGGFAMTLLEVRVLHSGVVAKEPIAWVPTIACGVGVIASVMGLVAPASRKIAMIAFLAVAISGVVGLYKHTEFEASRFQTLFAEKGRLPVALAYDGEDEGPGGEAEKEEEAPPLAPLSLTGLAFIGMIVLSRASKD